MARPLTAAECDLVAGGTFSEIIVQASGMSWDQFNSLNPGLLDDHGDGGGGGSSANNTTPLNQVLQNETVVVVGHHSIYLPKNMTADQQAAAASFVAGVKAEDANISKIPDNAKISVTENWTDANGVNHNVTYVEDAADFKAQWNKTSFGVFSNADYQANLNGPNTNGTNRGSADVGPDPNIAGNQIAGFNLENTLMTYYNVANPNQAALEYLALHEVAHETIAGQQINNDTPGKVDNSPPGTPNYANENFANTVAVQAMQSMGLGTYNPTNGWQPGDTWDVPPPPPDVYDPGNGGGSWGDPNYPGIS